MRIHHVTAVAGEPRRNLDFYAGLLGMRLVKRTVNFAPFTTDVIRIHVTAGSGGYSRIVEVEAWGVDVP